MLRPFLSLILAFGFCLWTAGPASAGTLGPQDEARFKTLLQLVLDQVAMGTEGNGLALEKKGEITVENKGTYLAGRLPHLVLNLPDGGMFNIGVIAINGAPDSAPGLWKVSQALPASMFFTFHGKKGDATKTLKVSFGTQKFSSVYDENLKATMSGTGSISSVRFESNTPDPAAPTFETGEISYSLDYKKDASGFFSGPLSLVLKNLQILSGAGASPDKTFALKIGQISVVSQNKEIDFTALRQFQEKMHAVFEAVAAQKNQPAEKVSPEFAHALFKTIVEGLTTSYSGAEGTVEVSNISFIPLKEKTGAPTQNLSINRVFYAGGMDGLRTDKVSYHLAFGADGMNLPVTGLPTDPLTPLEAAGIHAPQKVTFDMTVHDIPLKDILKKMDALFQAQSKSPDQAGMLMMQSMLTLPGLLGQAGTAVDLADLRLEGPDYSGSLKGSLKADMKAATGYTGAFQGQVTGLDETIAKLKASSDPSLANFLHSLIVLQNYGLAKTDASGKSLRTYDIIMNDMGQTMINGADLSAVGHAEPEKASPAP